MEELEWHLVEYAYVYAGGLELGPNWARTTSADPLRCARMVHVRVAGGSIIGIRVLSIDGQAVGYLFCKGVEANG